MARKLTALLCLLCLISMIPVQQTRAVETGTDTYIAQLISYYRHYQQEAEGDIQRLLRDMKEENPEEAARWAMIMEGWRWINEEMPVETGALPDGLAGDDSLCIVIMGFKLGSSGEMKPELISRLQVALESAGKYPNAVLVCTGGATSHRPDITEAGEMKKWLIAAGVEKERILTETRAASTPENATYVYELLRRNCPQVNQIAVITSDYHIYRSMTVFFAEAMLKGLPYELSANAVCATEMAGEQELGKQAKNLAELASVSLEDLPVPELQVPVTEPPEATDEFTEATDPPTTSCPTAATLPHAETEATQQAAEPEPEELPVPVFALAGFYGALLLALILLTVLIRITHPRRK